MKTSLDLSKVAQVVSGNKSFRYSDVQHKLQKVAFDVVRFIDGSDIEGLWRIQKDEQGEYIVATYDAEQKIEKSATEKQPDWFTSIDRQDYVHVFYKNKEVKKISAKDLNLPQTASRTIAKTLQTKLASDNLFVQKFISSLDISTRSNLLTSYPELKDQK
jgi:uncharacterized membrane protein